MLRPAKEPESRTRQSARCHRTDVTGTEPAASVPATAVRLPSGQANIAANAR